MNLSVNSGIVTNGTHLVTTLVISQKNIVTNWLWREEIISSQTFSENFLVTTMQVITKMLF